MCCNMQIYVGISHEHNHNQINMNSYQLPPSLKFTVHKKQSTNIRKYEISRQIQPQHFVIKANTNSYKDNTAIQEVYLDWEGIEREPETATLDLSTSSKSRAVQVACTTSERERQPLPRFSERRRERESALKSQDCRKEGECKGTFPEAGLRILSGITNNQFRFRPFNQNPARDGMHGLPSIFVPNRSDGTNLKLKI